MKIPAFEPEASGLPLHFLHANGYPPACYKPLLDLLKSKFRVFGMLLRPLWPLSKPEELADWKPLSQDLLDYLEGQKNLPVIGVGHSIGGIVTLRAALRDPQKFRALILVEPVLFPPYFILLWTLARLLGLARKTHPLINSALKRRREFDDLEFVFQGYRNRSIFRYMSDPALRAYITGITKPKAERGYTLAYTPEWEAQIYYSGIWRDLDLWRNLPKLSLPTLVLRGIESDTFREQSARRIERINPRIRVMRIDKSTHLLPLERPEMVYELIHSFIMENR